MAISRVGGPTVYQPGDSASTVTGSFTLTNGSTSGRFVEVKCSLKDNNAGAIVFSSVTFDGVACTNQIAANDSGSNQSSCSIWTIENGSLPASAGTYTVTATSSDSNTQLMFMEVSEFTGADSTTLVSGVNQTTAYGATTSISPSPSAGDYQSAIFAGSVATSVTATVDTGTQDTNVMVGSIFVSMLAVTAHDTAGTIGATFSVDPSKESAAIIGYNAAASGGVTIDVPAGSLTLTGQTPTALSTANQSVSVPTGSIALTGQVPAISTSSSIVVDVPAGAVTLRAPTPG